jgi:cell division protein ZapE
MYGGVGRGKSFIMDCFFKAVPLQRKTRLHFHEFMREVHRQLHELKGVADPLEVLAKRMARRHRLICFDEFHVADVTDAMILHRLLDAMFRHRMSIVTTSNFHPDELYPNGLHRDRILPAIELLKSAVGGGQCGQRHRLSPPHAGAGQFVPDAVVNDVHESADDRHL